MFLLLKDLFWRDQFSGEKTGVLDGRIDRDRYMLAFFILFAIQGALHVGAAYVFPDTGAVFNGPYSDYFELMWVFFSINIVVDPLLLVLSAVMACRMFGRWLMVPVGLLNYGLLSIMPYMSNLNMSSSPSDILVFTMLSISGGWLLLHIYVLFRPALSVSQPQHPLLRMNPRYAAEEQLNSIQFFWRCTVVGVVAGLLLIAGALALFGYSNGYGYSSARQEQLLIWFAMVLVISVIVAFWFLVQRLRNMGWNPLKTVLLAILLPGLFFGLQIFFYINDYYDSPVLLVVFYLLLPWARLALAAFNVTVIAMPAADSPRPAEAEEPQPVAG
ncbi:MAG: hypothetical protein LRY66_07480 [Saccharospirillaceae bacterium]|nr:hypothetical protein [Saccharospirillaceae bacterium]MCD8531192.1 hypothetical protein [Saccharospirillaceae bacterium]